MEKERASATIFGIHGFMVRFRHLEPCLKHKFKQKLEVLEERKTNVVDEVARLKDEEAVSRLKLSLFFIVALDDTGELLCKWYQYNYEEQSLGGGYLVLKFECGGSGETKDEPVMRGRWNKGKTMKLLVIDHQKAMEEACKGFDKNGVRRTQFFIKVQKLDKRFCAADEKRPLFEPFYIVKLKNGDRGNLAHPVTSLPWLEEEIKDVLASRGITVIFPIQSLVLELLKDNGSLGILGRVKIGTWKILEFDTAS